MKKPLQQQITELNKHLSKRITKQGLQIRDYSKQLEEFPDKVAAFEDAAEFWIGEWDKRFAQLERPWYKKLWDWCTPGWHIFDWRY